MLDDIFASKPWVEWRQIFDTYDIQYMAVSSPEQVLEDPQLKANDMLLDMQSELFSAQKTVNSPVQIEGVRKRSPQPAPQIGQHTVDVLAEAGFSTEEIDVLLEQLNSG